MCPEVPLERGQPHVPKEDNENRDSKHKVSVRNQFLQGLVSDVGKYPVSGQCSEVHQDLWEGGLVTLAGEREQPSRDQLCVHNRTPVHTAGFPDISHPEDLWVYSNVWTVCTAFSIFINFTEIKLEGLFLLSSLLTLSLTSTHLKTEDFWTAVFLTFSHFKI